MQLAETRITVVGLGLMGGSLSAALSGSCASLTGFDEDQETREHALQQGWFDIVAPDLPSALNGADLLILAVPVRSILAILERIGHDLPEPAAVMDLGSTKACVAAAMNRLPAGVDAIPGHPMCGRESSGISAADPALFQGCNFILCPLERTTPGTLHLAREIISHLEARPLELEPGLHDRLAALTSHLPYLLASTLVHTASEKGADQPVWELAASGFRDTSRVAASNLAMMIDILMTNKKPILEALAASQAFLHQLADAIEHQDEDTLTSLLNPGRQTRAALFTSPRQEDTRS